jgi:hypothetical protein
MDNTVPVNTEAEEAVLGSMLLDEEQIPRVAAIISPESFYLQRNRVIYEAMTGLQRRGVAVDFVTLITELEQAEQLSTAGGAAYISQLINSVASAVNATHYAELIYDTAKRRQILALASDLSRYAYDEKQPVDGKISGTATILLSLSAPAPATLKEEPLQVPALPMDLDTTLATGAGRWLDSYVAYAEGVSPMTPNTFHESAGLWLISAAIARRLVLNMAFDKIYPNLWVAWVAPSTLWGKSTSMNLARRIALNAYAHLLTPEDMTPEGLVLDMAGNEPANLGQIRMDDQQGWQDRRNFSAQRAWTLDEFSGLLASSGRDYNAGLIETLMRFYDCTEKYDRLTAGRGMQCIHSAYLSLLAASTPTALAMHLNSERLWGMGFWPRFGILAPESSRPDWKEPRDQDPPTVLSKQIKELYDRLPKPRWPDPVPDIPVTLGEGVYQTWNAYNKIMRFDMLTDELDQRLWAAYGRLPVHILKVAMLLASLDWQDTPGPRIEMRHLTRSMMIVETWRTSLHRVLKLAEMEEQDRVKQQVIYQISKVDPLGITMRDLCKVIRRKPQEIQRSLDELLMTGEVQEIESVKRKGPRTNIYILAR